MSAFDLRPYQVECLEAIRDRWEAGVRRQLVVLPTGSGKCVSPDTWVWSDGLCRFGDLMNRQGTVIEGPHGAAHINGWHDDGMRDGFRVITEAGWEIDGTAAHRIWIRRDDGFEGWEYAKKVRPGDYVALARGQADFGAVAIPEDEAYALGLLVADGHIASGSSERLQIDKQRPVVEHVEPVIERWRQAAGGRRDGRVSITAKSPNHSVLASHAPRFRSMLHDRFGLCLPRSNERAVPDAVLCGRRDTIRAFLRGYFDGDGTADSAVYTSSASRTLSEQVGMLLLGLGIYCGIRTKPVPGHLDAHMVIVYDLQAFDREIGMVEYGLSKDVRYRDLLGKPRNSNLDVVPGIGAQIHSLAASVPAKFRRNDAWRYADAYYSNIKRPSMSTVAALVETANSSCAVLSRVVEERRAWTRVKAVVPSRLRRIDCEVAEQHAFVGNGFINHNTVVFSHLKPFLGMQGRMLVLAHREELLEQAAAKIAAATPELCVEIEQANRHASAEADVVVASVATIGRAGSRRLLRLDPVEFDLLVCDEGHHAVAHSYSIVFEHFGALADRGGPLLVGVTATPERSDNVGLASVFDQVVYERTLREMVEEGWLCRIRAWRVDTTADLTGVHSRGGDFTVGELSAAVNTAYRNALAVRSFQSANLVPVGSSPCVVQPGRKRGVVFCCDVQHAKDMAAAFREEGIPAAAVTGETPTEERRELLQRFKRGEVQVLTNCMVLTEGFDEPSIEVIVMARPTQSAGLYMQMLGRGTRLYSGKEHLAVFDLVDNSRHGVPTAATLMGLPPKWNSKGGDVLKQADELAKLAEEGATQEVFAQAVSVDHARSLMREVDLLAGRDEVRQLSRFAWIRMPDGSYSLGLPDHRSIVVREDMLGQWHVARREPDHVASMELTFPSRERALSVADRFVGVAFPNAASLVRTDARWRTDRPSDKQVQLLRKLGKWREGLTKGDASDLLNASFGKRRRR